jgi:predicted RNA-binding Zn-ribbon protein involved in translation (DUF1610 family)
MKQILALAMGGFQSLGSDDSCERPVDRLGAMGIVGRMVGRAEDAARNATLCALGVDLIAFKFGKRETSKADAEDMLAAVLAWRNTERKSSWGIKVSGSERARIARWAVQEWANEACAPCTGTGISIDDRGVSRGCPACGGMKKRRFSETERFTALGGNFDAAMGVAHGIIGRAEVLATRHGAEMLERWPTK